MERDDKIIEQQWLIQGEVGEYMGTKGTQLQVVDAESGSALAAWMPHKNIEVSVATVLAIADDLEDILIEAAQHSDEE